MPKTHWLITLLLILGLVSCQRDTFYKTFDGKQVNLRVNPGVVCMTMTPDCPLCQTYSSEIVKLADSFQATGLKFYAILPGEIYSDNEIRHFQDSFGFSLPIIVDKDYQLTKELKATVTPEFFLLDSNMEVRYQGKFDDWATGLATKKPKPTKFYLHRAIGQYLAGEKISTTSTEPLGCFIEMD